MADGITRAWLVLLISACEKAGMTPIEKDRFHRIIYLSNCLAPLFEETPDAARLVKFHRGPFYPHVQRQLDHLGVCGALGLSDVDYPRDGNGAWMTACYAPNETTRKITAHILKVEFGRRLHEYLTEVVFAFAATRGDVWDTVALHDKNYEGRGENSLINLERENLAVKAAEHFRDLLPPGIRINRKQQLFVYLRLLERMSEASEAV
jgi:hypothetical protein